MGDSKLGKMAQKIRGMGRDGLRDIPRVVETLAGTFEIVTNRDTVDTLMAADKEGELWYDDGLIIIDAHEKRNRSQWEILLHEVMHACSRTMNMDLSEDNVQLLASFMTDFLERNGMLRRD